MIEKIPIQFRKYFNKYNGKIYPNESTAKYQDKKFVELFGNSLEEIIANLEKFL